MSRLRRQQFIDFAAENKDCSTNKRRDFPDSFQHFNQGFDGKHPFQTVDGVYTTALEGQRRSRPVNAARHRHLRQHDNDQQWQCKNN